MEEGDLKPGPFSSDPLHPPKIREEAQDFGESEAGTRDPG